MEIASSPFFGFDVLIFWPGPPSNPPHFADHDHNPERAGSAPPPHQRDRTQIYLYRDV